ncbi:hypothetical protein GYMLUDRAFT_237231 [Collybiopsis luxurians FD-317 M1]|nr:hypothetical protein GYMLUDRAFT_237231 [Collybiopsis luxurians FD-317 M1]
MLRSILALFTLILSANLVSSFTDSTPRDEAGPVVARESELWSQVLMFSTCASTNYANCFAWTAETLPLPCTSLATAGQAGAVESVASPSGIECTLFTGTACTGTSQLINGALNDLSIIGFSRVANSFSCKTS